MSTEGFYCATADCEFDVSEIFSAPRVCSIAKEKGRKPGFSIDIAQEDAVTGKSWDLSKQRDQSMLWGLLRRRRSRLLIASPPCKTFSRLQFLRKTQMADSESENGEKLLHAAVKACRMQHKMGLYFILEHPETATSWKDEQVQLLRGAAGVYEFVLDQCEFGLESEDELGKVPAKKPTRILTNMKMTITVMGQRCRG